MKRKAIYALGIGITTTAVIILVMAYLAAPSDTSSTREESVDSLGSLNNFEGDQKRYC